MQANDINQSPYVSELKVELSKINSDDFVHATRLLTEGKRETIKHEPRGFYIVQNIY